MTLTIPYLTKVDIPDMKLLKNTSLPLLSSRPSPWKRWGWIATGSVAVLGLAVGGVIGYRRYMNDTNGSTASGSPPSEHDDAPAEHKASSMNGRTAEHSARPDATWTKAELYEQAQAEDIDGRSSMSKAELIEALDGPAE